MSRKLWLIFLLAIFLRTLFFYVAYLQSGETYRAVIPYLDGYYQISENLLSGNGFSRDIAPPFLPDSVRTPLYPLLIAGLVYVFKSYYAVLVVHILLGSLLPLLAFRIARQLTASERVATTVALLSACEPFTILLSVTILSETFFTMLFLAGITLFLDYSENLQGRTLAFATAFLALAALARPTIQFLPLLLIIAILFLAKGRKALALRHASIVVGVFLIFIAPWSIRNVLQFGNPALSVQYASVPYGYLIPSVIALEKNIGFMEAIKEFYEGEGNIDGIEEITLANASYYKERTGEILKTHPVGLLKSVGVTFFTFFTHDGYLDVLRRLEIAPSIRFSRPAFMMMVTSPRETFSRLRPLLTGPLLLVLLGKILWVLISVCFFLGVVTYLKDPEKRARGIFVLLVVLYFALTTIAVGLSVNARFRFPVNAFMLTFAVYGVATVLQKRKSVVALPLASTISDSPATDTLETV